MMEGPISIFDDTNITVVGKLFLAGIAAATLGFPTHLKVRGNPDQVVAIKDAIQATRAFQDELKRVDVTVQQIMDKLEAKNQAAQRFTQATNLPWPV